MAKILITERQLERLTKLVLKEQNRRSTVSPVELVQMYMTNDLNKIISSKQDEIAGQYLVSIDGNYPTVKLNYDNGNKSAKFDLSNPGGYGNVWSLPINFWTISAPVDNIDLITELENSQPYGEDYKAFFAVNDDITKAVKRQINNVKVKFQFYTNPNISNDGFGGFKFRTIGKKKPKDVLLVGWGQPFPITEITPLGSKRGMRSNVVAFKISKKVYGEVQSGGLESKLAKLQLTIPAELLPTKPPVVTTTTPEEPEEDIIIPVFSVAGANLPYADNMVMPYFNKFPEAEKQFGKIVEAFVKYINAGGGDKLTNVTIKGSADSAAPNERVPSGYNKLDHPGGKLFGGIPKTDLKGRNQWLADNRAKQYANALIKVIKDRTGFDLKIEVLRGDNYYGEGSSKRGQEYRKITLTPNAPTHKGPAQKK